VFLQKQLNIIFISVDYNLASHRPYIKSIFSNLLISYINFSKIIDHGLGGAAFAYCIGWEHSFKSLTIF